MDYGHFPTVQYWGFVGLHGAEVAFEDEAIPIINRERLRGISNQGSEVSTYIILNITLRVELKLKDFRECMWHHWLPRWQIHVSWNWKRNIIHYILEYFLKKNVAVCFHFLAQLLLANVLWTTFVWSKNWDIISIICLCLTFKQFDLRFTVPK